MANLILTNSSSQVECSISQSYCRLTGSYSGPLNASAQPNSGFLIQNGNKQSGLFIGNTCITFYNNCLNFDPANTDVILNIPDTKNLIITGNGSILDFNGNGTLAVGTCIDTNYKGIQVVNSNPIMLLKDTDALNQSGHQAISFYDSNSVLFTSICNNPVSSINTGLAITDNATNFVYNKYFRLKNNSTNSNTNTLIASNCNLTLFSGDCLNKQYNFAVGGTSYFSSDLNSSGMIISNGLCTLANNSYLKGSGDSIAFNICNNKTNSSESINFYNELGGLHSSLIINQATAGNSEFNFWNTSAGTYSNVDRKQLSLKICGDKTAKFYGNISAETGYFAYQIKSNGIENSGCRTYLAPDSLGFHYFGSNANNCAYGISINSNRTILNHIWMTSGRSSMCLDFNQNLTVTGSLNSSGINSNAAIIINNLYNTDSCIRSRCITFCADGSNQNIINCGNFINYGSSAMFSGICSTGNQLNYISGCLCLQKNLYLDCVNLTQNGYICGPSGFFTTCVLSQVICSTSCVKANSICSIGETLNCFNSSLCVNGSIQAVNTTKAWGIYGVDGGINSFFTGWNIKSINIYQTNNPTSLIYAYGICLNSPIKYPFITNFNIYTSGNSLITGNNSNTQLTQSLGFSGNSNSASLLGSNTTNNSPYSINFYALSGKCSVNNNLAPYIAGGTYSEIYFNLANCKGPNTVYSELTKTNSSGIIHFSIIGV